MKKIIITINLVIVFIIIYLLHLNFFSWFNLAGVKPNLFVIFILCIGLFSNRKQGVIFGVIFGILLDLLTEKNMVNAILLSVIGFLGGYFDKKFSKDSKFTILIMVLLSTIIYESGYVIINNIINKALLNVGYFIRVLIIEMFYNSIITVIMYYAIIKYGYKIEEQYKEKRILTRYF